MAHRKSQFIPMSMLSRTRRVAVREASMKAVLKQNLSILMVLGLMVSPPCWAECTAFVMDFP